MQGAQRASHHFGAWVVLGIFWRVPHARAFIGKHRGDLRQVGQNRIPMADAGRVPLSSTKVGPGISFRA